MLIPEYKGIGIYKITNPHNGKCYIGSSKNVRNRIRQHLVSFNTRECNLRFMEDIEQSNDFIYEVLEEIPYGATEIFLLSRERYYANEVFGSVKNGYNVAYVNDSLLGAGKEIIAKRTAPIIKKETKKKSNHNRARRYKKEKRVGRYTGFM